MHLRSIRSCRRAGSSLERAVFNTLWFFCLFLERVSCNSGCPQTYNVVEDDKLVFLPLPPKFWDYFMRSHFALSLKQNKQIEQTSKQYLTNLENFTVVYNVVRITNYLSLSSMWAFRSKAWWLRGATSTLEHTMIPSIATIMQYREIKEATSKGQLRLLGYTWAVLTRKQLPFPGRP